MRVAIVGAGMGGLVLAQALARAGDDVHVYERDREVGARGGYRLHLHGEACAVLRRHLSPDLVAAVWASSAAPETFRQFAVTDHRLRVLALAGRDSGAQLLIGRVALRKLLCRGIEDRVHFGAAVVGHAEAEETVDVRFADGSSQHVDVLIGADGVGSRIAEALAGRPTAQRLGLGAIAARTWLPARDGTLVPPLLERGPALAVGPGGLGMFLTVHQPRDPALHDGSDRFPDSASGAAVAESEQRALIWGVLGVDRRFPADVRRRPATSLPELAHQLINRWHPAVRQLVRLAAPETAAYFSFSAADPEQDLTPWVASRVTALGDAVHAMPPTGGQAAATAIRDAGALADQLARTRRGELTLPAALAAYQTELATYAPLAVEESLQPVRWIQASSGRAATVAAYALLPVAAAVTAAARQAAAHFPPGRSR